MENRFNDAAIKALVDGFTRAGVVICIIAATFTLIILKLCGFDFSWWFCLLPLAISFIPLVCVLIALLIIFLCCGLVVIGVGILECCQSVWCKLTRWWDRRYGR